MRSEKQKKFSIYFEGEKMVCTLCKVVIKDFEPSSRRGEFVHPQFGAELEIRKCPNAGLTFFRESGTNLESFKHKRLRRAIKRGAKMARKLRP